MKPSAKHAPEPIADEDAPHLENIINGGLLRSSTPDHVAADFLMRGLIYKATGGLMPTEAGHYALMNWQKENAHE